MLPPLLLSSASPWCAPPLQFVTRTSSAFTLFTSEMSAFWISISTGARCRTLAALCSSSRRQHSLRNIIREHRRIYCLYTEPACFACRPYHHAESWQCVISTKLTLEFGSWEDERERSAEGEGRLVVHSTLRSHEFCRNQCFAVNIQQRENKQQSCFQKQC